MVPAEPAVEPAPVVSHATVARRRRSPIRSLCFRIDPKLAAPSSGPFDLQAALTDLFGLKTLESMFRVDDFPRRLTATIDNLGRSHASPTLWPMNPPTGRFMVEQRDGLTFIGADNGLRYTPYVSLLETANLRQAVGVYVRIYPSLQRAFEELGYPRSYFNDRLVEVIDQLLATPEIDAPLQVVMPPIAGPVRPERPWVLYEFADPKLQALTSGQKLLLRMGSVNERRVKARLAEIPRHRRDRRGLEALVTMRRSAIRACWATSAARTSVSAGFTGPGEGVVAREVLSLARGGRDAGKRSRPTWTTAVARGRGLRARHRRPGLRRFGRPDEPQRVVLDRGPATRPRPRPARGPERLRRSGARDSAARARGRRPVGRRRSGSRRPDRDPRSGHRPGRGRLDPHAAPAGAPSPAKAVTRRCAAATPSRTDCSRSCGGWFGHVSFERVLSGGGIVNLYRAHCALAGSRAGGARCGDHLDVSPRNRATPAASPPSTSSSASSEPSPATWR